MCYFLVENIHNCREPMRVCHYLVHGLHKARGSCPHKKLTESIFYVSYQSEWWITVSVHLIWMQEPPALFHKPNNYRPSLALKYK